MNNYKNIKLDKNMYKSSDGFFHSLQSLDPDSLYHDSPLSELDCFERQLKRFDIKVSGKNSDPIEKFFSTSDSAALFPAYISKAIAQGMDETNVLDQIIATKTNISAMDYRSLVCNQTVDQKQLLDVAEGAAIPTTTIGLQDNLVNLKKRGRMLKASYEAIKFQRLDLFTVTLKQMGNYIAKTQLNDAIQVLLLGDGNANPATSIQTAASQTLTYADLITLWNSFEDFEMNTMLVSSDMMVKMLQIEALQNPNTGLNFQGTGTLSTPLGAKLIKSSFVPAGTVIGLDKRFAIEMVVAGDVLVEYDKLIDCQLERAAITTISGFAKLFPNAVKVLKLKA